MLRTLAVKGGDPVVPTGSEESGNFPVGEIPCHNKDLRGLIRLE